MLVGVILLYTNMPEVPQEVPLKLKANDPSTKPISTPAPCNREALASPWWQGYYEAEQAEMQSHEKNGTWKLIPKVTYPRVQHFVTDGRTATSWPQMEMLSSVSRHD